MGPGQLMHRSLWVNCITKLLLLGALIKKIWPYIHGVDALKIRILAYTALSNLVS